MSAVTPGGVQRGELDRRERVLRWVEAGSGGPTVVLEAASGTPALTWTPILPVLARHTRVIAYDRAGLGVSDPAAPLTLGSQIDDLAALVSPEGDGPCVVVGHSWAGPGRPYARGLPARDDPRSRVSTRPAVRPEECRRIG
ncbi:alpha/beta fold hydrolase [Streptomyces sp. NPDC059095]|uniref:alpha/beta fold hydrolase n=1 Tax=unclassified Streptomyces TaxID=2593676 RepID=UPI0035E38199